MSNPAFLIFMKAPHPGKVKTRLIPFLSAEEAAITGKLLAKDTYRHLREKFGAEVTLVVVYSPRDVRVEIEKRMYGSYWTRAQTIYVAQSEGDLGMRMASAVEEVAAMGYSPLLLFGTDCPLLPNGAIRQALDLLYADQTDVVLGPAEDGGYYLVGLQKPQLGLFDATNWSTDAVLAQTTTNAERLGLRVSSDLPLCYDIDTPEDLSRLYRDLRADKAYSELTAGERARWDASPSVVYWLKHIANRLTAYDSSEDERP